MQVSHRVSRSKRRRRDCTDSILDLIFFRSSPIRVTVKSRSFKRISPLRIPALPCGTHTTWLTFRTFREMKMTGAYATRYSSLSIKICVITAFESSGPTRFATWRIILVVRGRNVNRIETTWYEARSESIRQIRKISTIGVNNYVDTIFTNEKCKDIHSTSI